MKDWNYISVLFTLLCFALLAGASWIYYRLIEAIHQKGAEELELIEKLVAHAVILITYLVVLFGIYLLLSRWVIHRTLF
jgi:hypothetical protein